MLAEHGVTPFIKVERNFHVNRELTFLIIVIPTVNHEWLYVVLNK